MNDVIFSPIRIDDLKTLIATTIQNELSKINSKPSEKEEELIKIDDVCRLLNVSKPTIFTWKKAGKIPFHRIGSQVYYKKSEVLQSLKKVNQ